MLSARNIAIYFEKKLKEKNITRSNKKIQKLLYYAYGEYLAKENSEYTDNMNRLFDDTIEAWIHGPAIMSIYTLYVHYYLENMKITEDIGPYEEFLNEIINNYGSLSASELEDNTHKERPWINARKRAKVTPLERSREPLKDDDIYKEFKTKQ